MTTAERPPILDRLHDVFVVLLLALRPLCWDGAVGQAADIVWQALAVAACLLVAVERAAGLRQAWAWSWRGLCGIALLLAILPTILRSPEPAPAWCFWSGLLASGGAAIYLGQVLAGRVALAWASLAGGLAVTAILGAAQPVLVLPAMAAAQQAGSSVFDALPGDGAAIAERIANGGAFATFTLANQFGSYLALIIPVVAGAAWASRGAARWIAAAVAALAVVALAATSAKGAWLALAAGCGLGWWLAWPGRWWRWLPLPLAGLALAAVLFSGRTAASVDVRLGYWRSAARLVAEAPIAGHGHMAFAAQQPRLMRPGDEPTRYVHNEPLEAAVAGGLPLAVLLLAGLAMLAWPRRSTLLPAPDESRPLAGVPWVLAGIIPYLALLGAFDGNLGWWPGGGTLDVVLGWSLLLGVVAALIVRCLLAAAPPPAWAVATGLLAVVLKSFIDFDLHAMGIVATALFVAVAAGHPQRMATGPAGRWLPLAGALLLVTVVVSGIATGTRLAEAEGLVAEVRQMRDQRTAEALARRLDAAPGTPMQVVAAQAALRSWELGDGAPGVRLSALEMLPITPQSRELAVELVEQAPSSAAAALRLANELAAAREWDAAAAEAERAVSLSPTSPRILTAAAGVLERVAGARPLLTSPAERARALRAEAGRLQPLVHPNMRTRG